ncbi:PREDICTED: mucin-2-like [Nicotiana attenuata]|uniref:mucin-2-like n=1 Tax=Nicotiana attenuata TaxID=49451 RepID=UPI000904FF98|nr:PREDICTED: mucin-2-like [Nicotiana attenuata]
MTIIEAKGIVLNCERELQNPFTKTGQEPGSCTTEPSTTSLTMANEQSSPSPAINTTPTSPPSLASPPETHSSTIPDTTVPTPVSSSSLVAVTPPSNPVSLPCVATSDSPKVNPTSPPSSNQTKEPLESATPQASENQWKEAAKNIMVIAAESLTNEGASPLPESQGEETPFLGDERTMVLFESPVHVTVTEKPVGEPDSPSAKANQGTIFYTKPLESIPPIAVPFDEDDEDDMAISARFKIHKPAVTLESSSKQPTTRLQKKEAFESALQKSKRSITKKKKRLMKKGEVVVDKNIPVVEVDEEAVEEPSSLMKRSTKVQKSVVEASEEAVEKQSETSMKSGGKSKKVVVEKDLSEGDTVAVASRIGKSVEMFRK